PPRVVNARISASNAPGFAQYRTCRRWRLTAHQSITAKMAITPNQIIVASSSFQGITQPAQSFRLVTPIFIDLDVQIQKYLAAAHGFNLHAGGGADFFKHLAPFADDNGFLAFFFHKE